MEVLLALEEKVKTLILHTKKIKDQLCVLNQENDLLKLENSELQLEKAKLVEGNAQITAQLNAIEDSILLETNHIHELKEERSVTRLVLDDLIKSIDSIVENEN